MISELRKEKNSKGKKLRQEEYEKGRNREKDGGFDDIDYVGSDLAINPKVRLSNT